MSDGSRKIKRVFVEQPRNFVKQNFSLEENCASVVQLVNDIGYIFILYPHPLLTFYLV